MSVQQMSVIAPLATTLPDPPTGDVLTTEQWATLLAIAETVIPEIRRASRPSSESQHSLPESEYDDVVHEIKHEMKNRTQDSAVVDYLGEGATTYAAFRRELQRTLAVHVRDDARKGISFILSTMK